MSRFERALEADPDVSEEVFGAVAIEAMVALDEADVPYVVIGGVASALRGRPRWTHDLDLLVRAADAKRVLEVLADADFETEETNPAWIFKALKDGVLVDVIFAVKGGIYLDDEMLARSTRCEFHGAAVRCAPPEDLVVVKAVAHDEPSFRHWHDALGIVADSDLDWDYLVRRAQHGARRVLSLLVYAQSNDLLVPDAVIRRLFEAIYDSDTS